MLLLLIYSEETNAHFCVKFTFCSLLLKIYIEISIQLLSCQIVVFKPYQTPQREKERNMTHSYDKNPFTNRKFQKAK